MRKRRILMLIAAVAMVMGVSAPASAGGHTASQLQKAGWACMIAGPHNWMHCFSPAQGQTVPVKVFGNFGATDDIADDGWAPGDPFLGTELLMLASAYHGQPCATDGGESYHPVPETPFVACHHFDTGSD